MEIRDAELPDLPALATILDELIDESTYTWSEQRQSLEQRTAAFHARKARGFPTLVAERDGAPIGVASFSDFRDAIRWPGYRFAVEHSVNVLRSAWGSGAGHALMDALIERARKAGVHAMVGAIDASNRRSLEFHAALGFREVGRMPELGWKHGRWCELVLVQRFVDPPGTPR